jgi:hypothetical protein
VNDLIERIALRFKSGNDVPIERAYITASEWEELRRDAERYRWLRDAPDEWDIVRWVECDIQQVMLSADLDEAIDAARGAEG